MSEEKADKQHGNSRRHGGFQKGNKWAFKKGQSGNPAGRPQNPEIEEFRKALKEEEKTRGKSLLRHAIQKAFTKDAVLIAMLKKMIPDLHDITTEINAQGDITLKYVPAKKRSKRDRNNRDIPKK
jgi:hypothetical protein